MRQARLEVYYDGWCPLCTSTKERLERLDWRRAVTFRSLREPGVEGRTGIPVDRLAHRMHALDRQTGRVSEGIYAVADLARHLPLLMPLWPLIRLSAALGLGQPLYDYIASRRAILPVGHCENGACPLKPPPT